MSNNKTATQSAINPGKFEIICDKEHSKILLKNKKDEIEIALTEGITSVTASIVRYSKATGKDGKIIQTTDTNGFTTQTVLDVSELDKDCPVFNHDFEYDTDYLYIVSTFRTSVSEDEQILPLFVKIPDELNQDDGSTDEEEIEEIPAPPVTVYETKKKEPAKLENYVVIDE